MKQAIWLSYDLGVRGDYEGIYTWLDERDGSECGDSLAFLKYGFSGDLIESLEQDIRQSIDVTKKTRIYVVWYDVKSKSMKGRFILGTRQAPPWTGYASVEEKFEDEGI